MFKVANRDHTMGRNFLSMFKIQKQILLSTHQHAEQMTNVDYVKEFVFKTL
jgi:hypothetical protein